MLNCGKHIAYTRYILRREKYCASICLAVREIVLQNITIRSELSAFPIAAPELKFPSCSYIKQAAIFTEISKPAQVLRWYIAARVMRTVAAKYVVRCFWVPMQISGCYFCAGL